MANQISLLQPHLGGKAYCLRSAIVHAIGSLLHKAFDTCVACVCVSLRRRLPAARISSCSSDLCPTP